MSVNIRNSSALAALKSLSAKRNGAATVPSSTAKPKAGMVRADLDEDEDEDEDEEYEDEDEDEDYEDEESVDESDDEADDEGDEAEDEVEQAVAAVPDAMLIREPLIALIELMVKHHKAIIHTLRHG